jgi:hypothetical protein
LAEDAGEGGGWRGRWRSVRAEEAWVQWRVSGVTVARDEEQGAMVAGDEEQGATVVGDEERDGGPLGRAMQWRREEERRKTPVDQSEKSVRSTFQAID